MKKIKTVVFSTILILSLPVRFVQADVPQKNSQEIWNSLSENQKNELRKTYAEWLTLPDSEKNHLKGLYKAYLKLSPEERSRVEANYKNFQNLPPEVKEKIRKNFKRFSQLSAKEREARLERLEDSRRDRSRKNRH